ncbi:MAG: toll/interleukin-1 receptor domain-containing protein, partial [Proteobacteria bacterium]|nr:toll/interleukin-1 receptor domain-containing protein [Pseudomonadota bacterium]
MPAKVFISYSHEDERWKKRVARHLDALASEGRLVVWDDRKIPAGDDWEPAIRAAMADCQVALLLISAAFLNSKFILDAEVPTLLQRRAAEGVRVIPVILSSCAWRRIKWLKPINARPVDGQPLDLLSRAKAEAVLTALATEIDDLLATVAETRTDSPHVDLHHLPEGAADFFGRGADLEWLDAQWQT